MPLNVAQVMLFDLLTDKVITIASALKKVPSMTEEEVNAEIAKWETKSDEEMAELDSHGSSPE